MKKKNKRLLALGIALVLLAAGIAGYFLLLQEDDALKLQDDGRLAEFTMTRLVARFSKGGGAEQYYKVADVSQQGGSRPEGYSKARRIDDPDGDPLTNFFAYAAAGGAEDGLILVDAVAVSALEGLEDGQPLELAGQTGVVRYETAEGFRTAEYLMDSLYDEAKIRLRVTLPSAASDADLLALCEFMAGKITPDRRVSPLVKDFRLNFINGDRWKFLWNGLLVTLEITLFAVLIGIALGLGFYTVALVTYVALLCILFWFPPLEMAFNNRSNHFEVHLELTSSVCLQDFVTVIRRLGLRIDEIEQNPAYVGSGLSVYTISISVSNEMLKKYKTHTEIIEALKSLDYVYYIEEMRA